MKERRKLFIYVTTELDDKFSEWARKMGVTKSQFGNICIQAGMQRVIGAVSPLDAVNDEQMALIIRAAEKMGLDLTDLLGKPKLDPNKLVDFA